MTFAITWLMRSTADVPSGYGWLAEGERRAASRMRIPTRRQDYLLGRFTAKQILAPHLGWPPDGEGWERLDVRAAQDGSPRAFLDDEPLPFNLSISHRGGRGLCVLAGADVALGCDLEKIEPRSELFVKDYFTAAERALVAAAADAERPLVANLIWSTKESVLKTLRVGLRVDTRQVEVRLPKTIESKAGWRTLRAVYQRSGEGFEGWWRREGEFLIVLTATPAVGVPRDVDDPGRDRPDGV